MVRSEKRVKRLESHYKGESMDKSTKKKYVDILESFCHADKNRFDELNITSAMKNLINSMPYDVHQVSKMLEEKEIECEEIYNKLIELKNTWDKFYNERVNLDRKFQDALVKINLYEVVLLDKNVIEHLSVTIDNDYNYEGEKHGKDEN